MEVKINVEIKMSIIKKVLAKDESGEKDEYD